MQKTITNPIKIKAKQKAREIEYILFYLSISFAKMLLLLIMFMATIALIYFTVTESAKVFEQPIHREIFLKNA